MLILYSNNSWEDETYIANHFVAQLVLHVFDSFNVITDSDDLTNGELRQFFKNGRIDTQFFVVEFVEFDVDITVIVHSENGSNLSYSL